MGALQPKIASRPHLEFFYLQDPALNMPRGDIIYVASALMENRAPIRVWRYKVYPVFSLVYKFQLMKWFYKLPKLSVVVLIFMLMHTPATCLSTDFESVGLLCFLISTDQLLSFGELHKRFYNAYTALQLNLPGKGFDGIGSVPKRNAVFFI